MKKIHLKYWGTERFDFFHECRPYQVLSKEKIESLADDVVKGSGITQYIFRQKSLVNLKEDNSLYNDAE